MRFVFSKEGGICDNHVYLCFVPCEIFSYNFWQRLLFDMFSTLMSIDLKLKVKTEHFLTYGYNAGPPTAIPIYTVLLYCVIGYPAIDTTEPTAFAVCQGMQCTQRGHAHYMFRCVHETFVHNLAGRF